jgi:hypothetical protein
MKMTAFWDIAPCSLVEVDFGEFTSLHGVTTQKNRLYGIHIYISEVLAASIMRAMSILIALMMEAASISETSANFTRLHGQHPIRQPSSFM